jgi:DNA invertase Pin-like site-specific DNA recombinase
MRVGIYLRVSTAGQNVENQRADLMRVIDQRDWIVVGEYVDHGISGAKGRDARPDFDRLCRDASQGKVDLVAAWSLDRIGRSIAHLVRFLEELRAQKVGLYLHQQAIDTSSAAGELFFHTVAAFAQFERRIIVERVNSGLARARAQGKTLGRPPITSRIESRIRHLRRKGLGKVRIAKQLHCGVSTVSRVLAT